MAKKKVPALVESHRGVPCVSSIAMAEVFGRRHDSVLRAIRKVRDAGFDLRNLAEIDYLDAKGRRQPCYRIPEREALVIMPFVGGSGAVAGQTKLVDAFLTFRRLAARRRALHADEGWRTLRALAGRVMADFVNPALIEARRVVGKETLAVHFMSEASLINGVVTDRFTGGQLEDMPDQYLRLFIDVGFADARCLLQGMSYPERKARLLEDFTPRRLEIEQVHGAFVLGFSGDCDDESREAA